MTHVKPLNLNTKDIWWILQLGYYDISFDLFRKSLLISFYFYQS